MNSHVPPIFDSYSYQSYQRQRQMTLGDLLLENRIVFLQGEIYTGNANELVMKLLYLQSENRRKDIHFYLNSPGGDVAATLAIYDTMQILSCPVATYCVGQAASGAADGLKLALNVGAMLIAFIALIALINGLLGWGAGLFGYTTSLQQILGVVLAPLAWIIGVPTADIASKMVFLPLAARNSQVVMAQRLKRFFS